MNEKIILSISGGKDSTAMLALAVERQIEFESVFSDTGHEHPLTYAYVDYLSDWLTRQGLPAIRRIKADFTQRIAAKAQYVREKWPEKLMAPQMVKVGERHIPSEIEDEHGDVASITHIVPVLEERPGFSADEAQEIIDRAIAALKPTGIPFLDLCIWKGRFPSTRARFCSEELKKIPIDEQVILPLLRAGCDVQSWQGVRADESESRRHLPVNELKRTIGEAEHWIHRPILQWSVDDVFAMHRKHGLDPNPLYKLGMGRVGCMPCIHCKKDELREIANRFPEEIARVAEWERIVSRASKRGRSTFFAADKTDAQHLNYNEVSAATHGIEQAVIWSRTSRGKSNLDLFFTDEFVGPACTSIYGLCE